MGTCDDESNVLAMVIMAVLFVALTWAALAGECNQASGLR
jgi:hypothetical protein